MLGHSVSWSRGLRLCDGSGRSPSCDPERQRLPGPGLGASPVPESVGVDDSEADPREYVPNTRRVLRVSRVSLTGKAVTRSILKGRPAIVFHGSLHWSQVWGGRRWVVVPMTLMREGPASDRPGVCGRERQLSAPRKDLSSGNVV